MENDFAPGSLGIVKKRGKEGIREALRPIRVFINSHGRKLGTLESGTHQSY